MKLPLGRVAAIIGAAGDFSNAVEVQGYSIDSRTVAPGELFFAVRGERLDGHDYVLQALEKGAAAAVVSRRQLERFPDRSRLLVVDVDDPLAAMHALATAVRQMWGKPVVAITGSAGKTTTKEMVARLLSTRYRLLKTEGNFNNHFGLPLQLLRLEPEHDLAVLELGMSHAGEIAALAALAKPNVAVVTNVAPVHLGFFNSIAEIAEAKREIIGALPPDGIAVLNADDEQVSRFSVGFTGRVITFGLKNPATVRGESAVQRGVSGSEFQMVVGCERAEVKLPLIGGHNILNSLAAVAVALQFGITLPAAAAELGKLGAVDKRGEVLQIGGATVINDCYNSNPRALDSMVDSLATVEPAGGGRRIVVAGEMLELGPAGAELHRRCGENMARRGVDVVLGIRGEAREVVAGAQGVPQAEFLETPELAGEWLAAHVRPGDVVLLKASRGVRLEKALEIWRARRQAESIQ